MSWKFVMEKPYAMEYTFKQRHFLYGFNCSYWELPIKYIYIYIKWTCDDGNAIVVWILGLLVSFIFSHFDGIGVTFFRHNCLV